MKIICITNLFPYSTRPGLAPFNRQQLIHVAGRHELHIIAPVPWPHRLKAAINGSAVEPLPGCRELMDIHHPVYFYTPFLFRSLYGRFYVRSIRKTFREIARLANPDLVYATWAYPDCYAASVLASQQGLPLVSRVHGSDINRLFNYPRRRQMILEAMQYSEAVISVSRAMKEKLVEAGIDSDKIRVVLNGVDRDLFSPSPRDKARRITGIPEDAEVILFAGNLKKGKGVDLLLRAFEDLARPSVQLHIIGDGPEMKALRDMREDSHRQNKIFIHGRVDHRDMPGWYNSCDLFCLPSFNEGTPNVILEALSCSRPVVASGTGGIPDIVNAESGILFPPGDGSALRLALDESLEMNWDRGRIKCPAGSWDENASELDRIFSSLLKGE